MRDSGFSHNGFGSPTAEVKGELTCEAADGVAWADEAWADGAWADGAWADEAWAGAALLMGLPGLERSSPGDVDIRAKPWALGAVEVRPEPKENNDILLLPFRLDAGTAAGAGFSVPIGGLWCDSLSIIVGGILIALGT